MFKLNSEYQKYNPFRRPDWRWERILKMIERYPSPGRCTKRDDQFVRTARNFLLRWRSRQEPEREELYYENPGLAYAYAIFEKQLSDPDQALFIEARLLAKQDFATIAKLANTIPQTIEWYEALFFNVSDRLEARDWITKQVLVPSMLRNIGAESHTSEDGASPPWEHRNIAKPFMDGSLKMFAYFGGPKLCELFITGFRVGQMPSTDEQCMQYLDEHFSRNAKMRSAQAIRTFEVNKYNVMELFAVHTQIMQIEKSVESTGQKYSSIEKHVGALMDELPWLLGDDDDVNTVYGGTDVPKYDATAGELRDAELLMTAAGDKTEGLDILDTLKLPPARKKGETAKDAKK